MKKATASILALLTLLFCFAGCNKLKGTTQVVIADGQTKNFVTAKGGALATDQNGNFIEVVTDEEGSTSHTQAVNLNTALVYGNTIYFTDYNITLPDGWSNNSDNSSYTQANIVDDSGNLITIRESDRTVSDCLSTANSIINGVKDKYEGSVITSKNVKIGSAECPLRSFYIPDAPDGTNPYMAYIIIEHNGVVLDIQIESSNNLTDKLDSIINVLATIKYNKKAEETTTNTTAVTIETTVTTAATTTKE